MRIALNVLRNIPWDAPVMVLLLFTGIWLFIRLGCFPIRYGKRIVSDVFRKKKSSGQSGISARQALLTALAGTIGTGNIAGVAGAIALGGPGAVFWMWISALFGMATKYAEIVLTMETRYRDAAGTWHGGTMIAIRDRFGPIGAVLSTSFSLFTVLASFGIGNMVQMHTIADATVHVLRSVLPMDSSVIALVIGIVTAALIGIWTRGGARRVGSVAEKLVPLMSAAYLLATGAVAIRYARWIPTALGEILQAAFCPRSVLGAAAGIGLWNAVSKGIGRGVFSNEAGLGSAPLAYAASDADSSVRRGFYGVFEVFFVTMVVCTVTAFTILLPAYGNASVQIPYGTPSGAELVRAALATVFGTDIASVLLCVVLDCFALSSILTWHLYGERCFSELFGTRARGGYRAAFLFAIPVASILRLDLVWQMAEWFNLLMTVPNLISLLLLSDVVVSATRRYFHKPKESA